MIIKGNTSRMMGDYHVRFCERLAGETPACLLSAPQTHLWLIKHWLSASSFVVKIANFLQLQTVMCDLYNPVQHLDNYQYLVTL